MSLHITEKNFDLVSKLLQQIDSSKTFGLYKTEEQKQVVKNFYDYNFDVVFKAEKMQDIYDGWSFGDNSEQKDQIVLNNLDSEITYLSSMIQKDCPSSFKVMVKNQLRSLEALKYIAEYKMSSFLTLKNTFSIISTIALACLGSYFPIKHFSDHTFRISNSLSIISGLCYLGSLILLYLPTMNRNHAENLLKSKDCIIFQNSQNLPVQKIVAAKTDEKIRNVSMVQDDFNPFSVSAFYAIDYYSDILIDNLSLIDNECQLLTPKDKSELIGQNFKYLELNTKSKEYQQFERIFDILCGKNHNYIFSSTINNLEMDQVIQDVFDSKVFVQKYLCYTLKGNTYHIQIIANPQEHKLYKTYEYILAPHQTVRQLSYDKHKKWIIHKDQLALEMNPLQFVEGKEISQYLFTTYAPYAIITDKVVPYELLQHIKGFIPKSTSFFSFNSPKISNGGITNFVHSREANCTYTMDAPDFKLYEDIQESKFNFF